MDEGTMILKKLTLKNYRAFEEFEIEFHDKLAVIVGVNGAGKTTVLDAAAAALSAYLAGFDGLGLYKITPDDARVKCMKLGDMVSTQPQYPVEIDAAASVFYPNTENGMNTLIEEIFTDKPVVWKRFRKNAALNAKQNTTGIAPMRKVGTFYQTLMRIGNNIGAQFVPAPILVYYSTRRFWGNGDPKDMLKANISCQDAYKECLDAHLNLSALKTWFERMTYKELQAGKRSKTFGAVRKAMAEVFEDISGSTDVDVWMNLDTREIEISFKDTDGAWNSLTLNQLSDGYKGTICLIADIAYRMAVLNPQLEENVLKNTGGIVLIDEVDLHLHPAWQQRILSDLMNIFPKVQFIVSSHAPSVISCVKTENLRILRNNQIEPIAAQVYGEDVNSLLQRVMEVPARNPKTAKLFDDFYRYLKDGQFSDAENTLNQIELQRDYHDTELAGCRTKLKLERIRRG